jgi:hypothetical protein
MRPLSVATEDAVIVARPSIGPDRRLPDRGLRPVSVISRLDVPHEQIVRLFTTLLVVALSWVGGP